VTRPAIVALGGGHGLAASLGALRHLTDRLTAVVTVADDGGSSGRLRQELGVLPPGDLRMALAALCADDEWGSTWRDVLQHRFASGGELHAHAVGNLLIVALWELLGDQVLGLDWVARLLGAQGRVLPMSPVPLHIEAMVAHSPGAAPDALELVHGQVAVATTACAEAVEAIHAADWVVLGPGSWFTSVMPHLLVPDLRDALCHTAARRCITLNLVPDSETGQLAPRDLLESLLGHAPELTADVVLADPTVAADRDSLRECAERLGAVLVVAPVAHSQKPGVHDRLRLAAAYRDVLQATT
jgi:uncharacterized cofD-like protein